MKEQNNGMTLSLEELCKSLTLQATAEPQVTIASIEQLDFFGKIWQNMNSYGGYPGVWGEALGSDSPLEKISALQNHKLLFALMINDWDEDMMLARLKPQISYDESQFDHLSVAESRWAIAFMKESPTGDNDDNTAPLNGTLDSKINEAKLEVNKKLPLIEKYSPEDGSFGDRVHLIMRAIK